MSEIKAILGKSIRDAHGRSGEVIDLVERVRLAIRYLRGGREKSKAKSKAKAWWNSETSGSKAREWKW